VVFARTDPEACARGISAFLVEKRTPGVAVGKAEKKMGIRGTVTSELHFRDVRVPAANLLGEPGNGLRLALATLDLARPTCAAQALGIAQAAFEEAVAYARQRRQFGQRIADFEAIQFMLADMATQLEAGKLLLLKTCALHDAGERRITAEAAMCKLFCSEAAKFIVDRCVQIHGGMGYSKDLDVERHFRDARITEIYEGTSEIQRLVIARHILAD
jgi:butyryl-CoA dehydrogenase